MKEYKIAKGWAIFIYITAPLLIGLFGWLLILPFSDGDFSPSATWIFIPISLGMITLMVLGLIETINGKVVIDNEKIYTISPFSNRQLNFNQIKGYRLIEKYIVIEPISSDKKRIKISSYYGKSNEIILWLASNYSDLDSQNELQEQEEILLYEEFGRTIEEREAKLKKARKTAKLINWSGGIVAAFTIFWADPYEYSILASFAMPLVAIMVMKFSGGLLRIDERKESAYPSILYGILAPSCAIFIRALIDFDIFDYTNVWLPSLFITAILLGVILIGNKEFKFKKAMDYFSLFSAAMFLFGFSFGTLITLNCYYDKSEPEIYNAKILDKRISSGKSSTCYFELTPWGKRTEKEEVSVSKRLYNLLDKDDEINIFFRTGKFNIPWFTVREKE
jgi:cell shape-determining protein MreD